ncbi:GGDEF domain-containing protein [Pseudooctadecabacter jejudonensis]|uniref:diguanylate cyclase n=1 Tax=Pseudooctadecabacter jejudonensis TaxID=1391910 RepID=A0A1Y5RJ92_9RHOB|nr:GGDEF domain-containing protein [Pseudooctadecabacter jejudonensis]SLN18825.1 putative diguanylate cyclase YdaM [Pseudooctadecabacter jejudonensis]
MTFSILNNAPRQPLNYIRLAIRARFIAAAAMIGCAGVGLWASFLGINIALQPLEGGAATHPLTAVCLIALGVCILKAQRYGAAPFWQVAVLGTIVAICAARLMDAVLTGSTGTTSIGILGAVDGFSGRFSVEAAGAIGGFAMAMLLRQTSARLGALFMVLGVVIVHSTILQLSYGVVFFGGDVGSFTFLGLAAVSVAMVSVYLNRPFVRIAFAKGGAGAQTRIMLTTIVFVPWAAGIVLLVSGSVADGVVMATVIASVTLIMAAVLMCTIAYHENATTAKRRAELELAMMSRIDAATGALNRFGVTERVEAAWLDFRTTAAQFGVIMMDLDYFRRLDATFGAGEGEGVLARVAQTLDIHLRDSDAFGRWGSNEFLLVLPVGDVRHLEIVATRLRAALANPENPLCEGFAMMPATMEVPLGISAMTDKDDAPTDAIVRADVNLHTAKADEASTVPVLSVEQEDMFIFAGDTVAAFDADAAADSVEASDDDIEMPKKVAGRRAA